MNGPGVGASLRNAPTLGEEKTGAVPAPPSVALDAVRSDDAVVPLGMPMAGCRGGPDGAPPNTLTSHASRAGIQQSSHSVIEFIQSVT